MTPDISFLYSYTGGMPPETLEVFWIHQNGPMEYVAGNPWPAQPPFDEVGYYRRAASVDDLDPLYGELDELRNARPTPSGSFRSADAGLEYVRAELSGQLVEREWNPNDAPHRYAPLVAHVRQLITRTRESPVNVCRASWELAGGSADALTLVLDNRGSAPFVFDDLQSDEETRAEVRVRVAAPEPAPPNPLILFHRTPLPLVNPPGWRPAAGGQMVLEPGETLRIKIERRALEASGAYQSPGVLESLIRLSFRRPKPEGGTMLEQGWMMPALLTIS